MQTRKEGERGREQADRTPFCPNQNSKSHRGLVQAEGIESHQALPTGSHLDVKRNRLSTYCVLWQTHVEERRPQAPTMLISRETHRPLFPDNRRGNCSWTERHTHSTHAAPSDPQGLRAKATLQPPSCPTHRSQCLGQSSSRHRPWTQGLPGQGSPHCPLFARGPPAAAVQLCFCQAIWGAVPCAASDQCNILPARQHAHRPPLKGCFVFLACKGRKLFLQLNNTVWGLQSSNGSQKPPAHECHTPLPRMPASRGWTIDLRLNKAQRDVGPLLATLHRLRLLWKLLVLTASGNGPTASSSLPPMPTHAKNFLRSNLDPSCFSLVQLGPP